MLSVVSDINWGSWKIFSVDKGEGTRVEHKICYLNPFKVYSSQALSIFTTLCH